MYELKYVDLEFGFSFVEDYGNFSDAHDRAEELINYAYDPRFPKFDACVIVQEVKNPLNRVLYKG